MFYGQKEYSPAEVDSGINSYSTDYSQFLEASFNLALKDGLGRQMGRKAERMGDDSEYIAPDVANKEYGTHGLSFDAPVRRNTAKQLYETHSYRNEQMEVISRNQSNGLAQLTGTLGAGFAASFTDPVELGLNFIPITKLKYLKSLNQMKGLGGVVTRGAVEGAGGAAIGEPARMALNKDEQIEYGISDAFTNILTGAAMGGTLHVAGQMLKDGFHPSDNQIFFKNAIDRIANGDTPDAEKILNLHPKVIEAEVMAGRTLSDEERVDVLQGKLLFNENQYEFKTSKGSTYSIDESGGTIRNKSLHKGHDPKDIGIKEKSSKTVYVDSETARIIGDLGLLQADKKNIYIKNGRIFPAFAVGDAPMGLAPTSKEGHIFTDKPEIGKHPIELWKPSSDALGEKFSAWHAGNDITEIHKQSNPKPEKDVLIQEAVARFMKEQQEAKRPVETPEVRSKITGAIDENAAIKSDIADLEAGRFALVDEEPTPKKIVQTDNSPESTAIHEQVKTMAEQFPNAPKVDVISSDNLADLPKKVRNAIENRKSNGKIPEGLMYKDDNGNSRIVLFSDTLSKSADPDRATKVFLHEAIGHYGVRGVLGDSFDTVLKEIYPTIKDDPIFKEIESRYNAKDNNGLAVEEYLANLAETNPQSTIFDQIERIIKNFLKTIQGKEIEWTRADTLELLQNARKFQGETDVNLRFSQDTLSPVESLRARKTLEFDDKIASIKEQIAKATDPDKVAKLDISLRDELYNKRAFNRILDEVAKEKDGYEGMFKHLERAWNKGKRIELEGMNDLVERLKKDNLLELFGALDESPTNAFAGMRENKFSREIAHAVSWAAADAEKRKSMSAPVTKDFEKLGQHIFEVKKALIDRANANGALISQIDHIASQSHDKTRMRRGSGKWWQRKINGEQAFKEWRNEIEPKLDWQRIEKQQGGVADKESFLRSSYDNLVTGVHDQGNGGRSNGSLSQKMSVARKLHFIDSDSWVAYNSKYGTGSVTEAIMGDVLMMSQNIGLLENFGTNPRKMFEMVTRQLAEEHGKTNLDLKNKLNEDNRINKKLDNLFKVVSGEIRDVESDNLALIGSTLRTIQSTSKLGGAVVSSVADFATAASKMNHLGMNYLDAYGKGTDLYLKGLSNEEGQQIARALGTGLDAYIGSVMSRFDVSDGATGSLAKMQSAFFKLNLLQWHTESVKKASSLTLSNHLASFADKTFTEMSNNPKLKILTNKLKEYNISHKEWDLLRKTAFEAESFQGKFITPDKVYDIADGDIAKIIKNDSPRAIQSYKEKLSTDFGAFLVDQIDEAVIAPSARDIAISTQGTSRGTLEGEAIRLIMQFKSFPATVSRKLIGGRMASFDNKWQGGFHIAGLALQLTAAGYLAMTVKDFLKGKERRDPKKKETWLAAMVQGGGAGIYGDFLQTSLKKNRFGNTALETLMGPTFGAASELSSLPSEFVNGKNGGAKTAKLILNNTPFINLIGARQALDYSLLYSMQEALSPGYLRRMESDWKKDTGQGYIFSPSNAADPFNSIK